MTQFSSPFFFHQLSIKMNEISCISWGSSVRWHHFWVYFCHEKSFLCLLYALHSAYFGFSADSRENFLYPKKQIQEFLRSVEEDMRVVIEIERCVWTQEKSRHESFHIKFSMSNNTKKKKERIDQFTIQCERLILAAEGDCRTTPIEVISADRIQFS